MDFADLFGCRFELMRQINLLRRQHDGCFLSDPQLLDQLDGLGILRRLDDFWRCLDGDQRHDGSPEGTTN